MSDFRDELAAIVKTPEELERERQKQIALAKVETYKRCVHNEYEGIKNEIRERAKTGRIKQISGHKVIMFFSLVGKAISANDGSGKVDLVDVEISNWNGKHTYTINETGQAFYNDVALLCAKDGIMTEQYLVAFSPKNSIWHYGGYEWNEIIDAESSWYTQENVLKAPCRNGYTNWGQEKEGIAIKVTVIL